MFCLGMACTRPTVLAGSLVTERRMLRKLWRKLYVLLLRLPSWDNEGTGYNCSEEFWKDSPGKARKLNKKVLRNPQNSIPTHPFSKLNDRATESLAPGPLISGFCKWMLPSCFCCYLSWFQLGRMWFFLPARGELREHEELGVDRTTCQVKPQHYSALNYFKLQVGRQVSR